MRRALATLAATLLVAGCGADDEPAPVRTENDDSPSLASPTPTPSPKPSATPPTATAPSAPAPPPDAGVAEGHGAEDQEGGAGDEEAARTPVDLVVRGEEPMPRRVEVPAFLAIELRVRNDASGTIGVRVPGTDVAFRVPAGETRGGELEGLRPGRKYAVDIGTGIDTVIVAVAEPGP